MSLSPREQEVLRLLRSRPMLDAQGIADLLGTSKGAVAVALSSLTRKGEILGRGYVVRDEPYVVVIGGSVMDLKAHSVRPIRSGTSNPAVMATTPGGVGRNIAENLARLGRRTRLVSVVGRDPFGQQLIKHTAQAGVEVDDVVRGELPTGTYLAALDDDGELHVGLSDMRASDELAVEMLVGARDTVMRADLVVVDGNLPVEVAAWGIDLVRGSGASVVVEPVSVAKAARLAPLLSPQRPIHCITPNLDELSELVGRDVAPADDDIVSACAVLHERGVEQVWVRRGPAGSLLCMANTAPVTLTAPDCPVVDVTGAGDSMTAAYVHALLRGDDPVAAARFGHAAAALTVASAQTVRSDLTEAAVDHQMTQDEGART